MRVAMFHANLPQSGRKPGGVEVFVHRLANSLADRGHEIEVLTYSGAPPDAAYAVRELSPRRAQSSRLLRQYVASWGLNFQDLSRFEVAHTHGDDWFWLHRTLPVVRTFHGSAKLERRTASSLKRRIDKTLIYPLELAAALAERLTRLRDDPQLRLELAHRGRRTVAETFSVPAAAGALERLLVGACEG